MIKVFKQFLESSSTIKIALSRRQSKNNLIFPCELAELPSTAWRTKQKPSTK